MSLEIRGGSSGEFWRLLAAYEDATIQEAVALNQQDFVRLDTLHESKRVILSRMVLLGERLGIDRRNQDFRLRLQALEQAEGMNLDAARAMMGQIRKDGDGVLSAQRRLTSLRSAYAGDTPPNEFFAEG